MSGPAAPRPPRTALVHDWLTGMRGGEAVLEAIAAHFPAAPIFTLLHVPGSVSPALEAHPIHTSFLQRVPGVARHYRRLLPLFPTAVEDFDLAGFDLVISSSHCAAKGARAAPGASHLCYCHTPMRYAWDQETAYFPRRRGLGARLRGLALTGLRTWDVASAARVDMFLANSRFVAERIRRYYRREAEVVPPPVATDFFTPAPEGWSPEAEGVEPGTYCLAVAALSPYKRLELALEACRDLALELRVVGTGPDWGRLRRLAGSGVRLYGRVSGERLRALYRGAQCLLQPGIEDFGIAAVEALACGTPVVALGRGGVLDQVDDGVHGVLFDEGGRAESLAAAIDRRRQIRFNPLDLRRRAEAFSILRFNERLKGILARIPGLAAEGGP